jgi:arylsulfatase A-like enzyme/Flp pilus assembly protein TadD
VLPDVVIVTWDTTRADHVGPDAAIPGLTPHWDRLAAGGVRFRTARTPSPMTLPAHASLMTGRLPSVHGARVNSIFSLPETADTLAERLAAEGWQTAAFVSAAVLDGSFGLSQGFHAYDDRVGAAGERDFAERRADATVDAALEWIGGVPDAQPVFLWVHLFDPHTPWEPPAEWVVAHPGEPYRAEIAFTDEQTGRLLAGLSAAGRLDRTLLVMTSDHGEGLGEHGERTHGYFLYDSTVRVPLLFWAGEGAGVALPKDRRVDVPVLISDVAPTLVDLLGLEPESSGSTSVAPLLRGGSAPPRELALESLDPYYVFGVAPAFGVVDTRGEVWIDLPRRERYDVRSDPGQLRNLFEPSVAAQAGALFARHPRAWPPGEPSGVPDSQRREQLVALGYLIARTGAGAAASGPRPDPKDLLPVAALWMGQHDSRRPDEALAQAEGLAHRFGPLPALAFFRADRLQQLSRPDAAIAVLREASEAHPAEARLRAELEAALGRRSEDRALAKRIRAVWEEQPDHPGAAHDLAVVLHRLGETAEAERLYRQWLRRHPEDDTARLDLHRLLGARGAYDEALALLRGAAPGPARSADLDCAEGRLLAWWMHRSADAKQPLRACRDKGAPVEPRELELIGGRSS